MSTTTLDNNQISDNLSNANDQQQPSDQIDDNYVHPLITQNLVDTKKYYCPFFERGFCRKSSQCTFSHDQRASTKIPNHYCHFYLANQCFYGQECKFRHSEPPPQQNLSQQLPSPLYLPHCQIEPGPSQTSQPLYSHVVQQSSTSRLIAGKYFRRPLDEKSSLEGEEDFDDDDYEYETSNQKSDDDDEDEEQHTVELEGQSEYQVEFSADSSSHLGEYSYTTDYKQDDSDIHDESGELESSCERPQQIQRPRPAVAGRQVATTSSSAATNADKSYPLCPYATTQGVCPFPYNICPYTHGLICDLCSRACLHPNDLAQQRQHRDDCLREHEREMELSFAVQRSKDKVCGICMDTVIEKKPITSSRFGILEKCNHVFCLDCIRKWRGTKQFDNRTIRACPECRVSSDFVVPSKFWVEDQDDKEKLIRDYKTALKSKPCRYFDEGKGECPFAGSCFYKHAYPDGRLAKPEPPRPRRRLQGARGSATRERMTNLILWNIFRSGEDDWHLSTEELDTFYFDRDWGPELTDGEEDSDNEW